MSLSRRPWARQVSLGESSRTPSCSPAPARTSRGQVVPQLVNFLRKHQDSSRVYCHGCLLCQCSLQSVVALSSSAEQRFRCDLCAPPKPCELPVPRSHSPSEHMHIQLLHALLSCRSRTFSPARLIQDLIMHADADFPLKQLQLAHDF